MEDRDMRYGTSHFISKSAAIRYYRQYHYDDTVMAVEAKIASGEIHIGKPRLKDNERLIIEDNRYFIDIIC